MGVGDWVIKKKGEEGACMCVFAGDYGLQRRGGGDVHVCGWVTMGYKEGGEGGRGCACVCVGDYRLQRRGGDVHVCGWVTTGYKEGGEGMYMCVCG